MCQPKYLYMAVTNDRFEMPLFYGDSPRELAEAVGLTQNTISGYLSKEKDLDYYEKQSGYRLFLKTKLRFIKVELPEEDEDLMLGATV